MNVYRVSFLSLIILTLAACSPEQESTAQSAEQAEAPAPSEPVVVNETNPLLAEWDTPFGIPPFSKIENEHYRPALMKALEEERDELAAIRDNPEPPTFENTVEQLELTGSLRDRVNRVFSAIKATDTNDYLQSLALEMDPLLTRATDAKYLDDKLFERVDAVYRERGTLDLDEQEARLLELTHREFVRRGAALDADAKERLKDINARIAELETVFGQNLLKETNAFQLVITDEADLAGLPADQVGSAKARAEARGLENAWVFGLDRASYEGFMTFADNRELRKQMFDGYRARAGQGGPNDSWDELAETARLRAERARLLGYANHAAYQLETRMARTPEQAESFLLEVWKPGLGKVQTELVEMQAIVEQEGHDFIIEGWDWWYYAEKLRQQKYAIDEAEVKPYFELDNVLAGAFYVANELFGVRFEPLDNVPVWHPGVKSFTVYGADDEFLGVFMADFYARDSKRGGAWMSSLRHTSNIRGNNVRPIVTNNMNLSPPPAGEPTLLSFDQVETLFHEFGHALHGLMTTVRYPRFAGTSGSPRDYTEFPAQFMEHYATQPAVLEVYARHAETGEAIPIELVERVRAASRHNQGFKTTEFIAASLLDLSWYSLSANEAAAVEDAGQFEDDVLSGYGLPEEIGPRYRSPYFAHVFSGGYSAGYYAYLWSEILDADGFTAFEESGDIYNPELAERLKKNVYQAGGLRDADELYRQFRGEDPSIEPLLRIRGLN